MRSPSLAALPSPTLVSSITRPSARAAAPPEPEEEPVFCEEQATSARAERIKTIFICLLHLQELDLEHEIGAGRDRPVGGALLAVGELEGDEELALPVHLHPGHAFHPAGDQVVLVEDEGLGAGVLEVGVELLAV